MTKDNCNVCGVFKKLKAYGRCMTCNQKIKHRTIPRCFLQNKYSQIKTRCTNPNQECSKYYKGLTFCTKTEFMNRFINDKVFLRLYKAWQESNFQMNLCPSIDRIDSTKGYTIDNIRFLEHGENCKRGKENVLIEVFEGDNSLGIYQTYQEIEDIFEGVYRANIDKVLKGQRKTSGGYTFKLVGRVEYEVS